MRFKHAFHVLVDNFSTTYKLLIYRIITLLIVAGLSCAVIIPTLNSILNTAQFEKLRTTFTEFWHELAALNTDTLHDELAELKDAFDKFKNLISEKSTVLALAMIGLILVRFIGRFFVGVGNYTTAALVNDRMCLHAKSSFSGTMIKNLGNACLYSIIYTPLALAYDAVGFAVVWALLFKVHSKVIPLLIKIFLCATIIILLYALKFALTCNWLPCLIQGKMNNRKAMKYSFNLKNKQSTGILSTAFVMMILIMALNVIAVLFTLGAGLLITIPATALMLISLQFVNYFDNNKLKYFVDDYTVIGPNKETPVSREDFFKGKD